MTATSELEKYCRRPSYLGFDATAFKAALQHDWDAGRDEQLSEVDDDGRNGVIRTTDGFIGFVGIYDQQTKRQLLGFRSIQKNGGQTWRTVVGKATDGRIIHVGQLRKQTTWSREHGYK